MALLLRPVRAGCWRSGVGAGSRCRTRVGGHDLVRPAVAVLAGFRATLRPSVGRPLRAKWRAVCIFGMAGMWSVAPTCGRAVSTRANPARGGGALGGHC